MEIGSGNGYPASSLSNFAPHHFNLDGVQCSSMEGFLQALKFKNIAMQDHVCTLVGRAAKAAGRGKRWNIKQQLYWRAGVYPRSSAAYQGLLDRAYQAMFDQSEGFKKALIAAGRNAVFTHNIGRTDEHQTVLTRKEFCSRLMKLKTLAIKADTLNKQTNEIG
jgi:predicted NAD-dependent protein-ADP-ribosyltransferase YbiA (DUF1768 family)